MNAVLCRLVHAAPEHVRVEPALHGERGDNERAQRVATGSSGRCRPKPALRFATERIQPRRSAASTGAVSGRTPRQSRNDSAACSTSIPLPSQACGARGARRRENGVSRPYTMS